MSTESPSLYGLCKCGCGKETPIAKQGRSKGGHVKGAPIPFLLGHAGRGKYRESRYVNVLGYVIVRSGGVDRREHVMVAERVLGKSLPKGAVVHHANRIKTDNRPENLVICQSHAYHRLIHSRMRAMEGCGNPDWRMCGACRQWDDPVNLRITGKTAAVHRSASVCPANLRRVGKK